MSLDLLPEFIRENYECHEWRHACSLMHTEGAMPPEFFDWAGVPRPAAAAHQ
jgi:hypothetical protein